MNCKGSWIHSARNINYADNNILYCDLRKYDGSWEYNKLVFLNEVEYCNINGKFQCIFDNSILFLIINMNKNKDRWEKIKTSFDNIKNKYNCEYLRVEGVDGYNMENDISIQEILKPRQQLLGTNFCCIESKETWIYDGSIKNSFPGLFLNAHFGTKGLTLSNIKCFDIIKNNNKKYNWYCILEDDSEINENIYNNIINLIQNNNSNEITILDKRGKGGTCAVLYNERIINHAYEHLHPLSYFSINNEFNNKRGSNLWDWKLWVYLDIFKIENNIYNIVNSGFFKSEIS